MTYHFNLWLSCSTTFAEFLAEGGIAVLPMGLKAEGFVGHPKGDFIQHELDFS